MRQLVMILTLAAATAAAAQPVAAQEGRREHRPVWIGAMCIPVDAALQAQLQLDDGVGLLVAEVVPESPAAQAGLKKFDVVTSIDGKTLRHVGQLMEAVDDAGDQSLKLELYRASKSQTIEVKPAERPRGDVLKRFDLPLNDGRPVPQSPEQLREWVEGMRHNLPEGEAKRMQEWMERMQRGEAMPLRMHVFGPGVIMHQSSGDPLPKGVSVTVKKNGDKPVEIHVERGDEQWNVGENELHKLPPELRGPVAAMLGGGAQASAIAVPGSAAAEAVAVDSDDVGIKVEVQPDVQVETRTFSLPAPSGDANTSRKKTDGKAEGADLDALKKQIEQLQRQLDELKKSLPEAATNESGAAKKAKP